MAFIVASEWRNETNAIMEKQTSEESEGNTCQKRRTFYGIYSSYAL